MSERAARRALIRRLRVLQQHAVANCSHGSAGFVSVSSAEEFNSILPQVQALARCKDDTLGRVHFSDATDNEGNYLEAEIDCESFCRLIDKSLISLDAPTRDLSDLHSAIGEEFYTSFHIIPRKWVPFVGVAIAIGFLLGVTGVSYALVREIVNRGLVAQLESEAAAKVSSIDNMVVRAAELLQAAETQNNKSVEMQMEIDAQRLALEELDRMRRSN